jgi:hypothetical protein
MKDLAINSGGEQVVKFVLKPFNQTCILWEWLLCFQKLLPTPHFVTLSQKLKFTATLTSTVKWWYVMIQHTFTEYCVFGFILQNYKSASIQMKRVFVVLTVCVAMSVTQLPLHYDSSVKEYIISFVMLRSSRSMEKENVNFHWLITLI